MTGDLDMYASSSVKALRAANKGNLIGFGSALKDSKTMRLFTNC